MPDLKKKPCSKCPYTLELIKTVTNPCPECKLNGYQSYEWFQKQFFCLLAFFFVSFAMIKSTYPHFAPDALAGVLLHPAGTNGKYNKKCITVSVIH